MDKSRLVERKILVPWEVVNRMQNIQVMFEFFDTRRSEDMAEMVFRSVEGGRGDSRHATVFGRFFE